MKNFVQSVVSLVLVALVFVAGCCEPAQAGGKRYRLRSHASVKTRCANGECSSVSRTSSSVLSHGHTGDMQQWAENEAKMMAASGTNGHVRPAPPGFFIGVGAAGVTCVSPRGVLVGEAHFQGKSVRVWKL